MKSYFYKCTSIQTTVVTVNLEVLFNTSNMKEAKKKTFACDSRSHMGNKWSVSYRQDKLGLISHYYSLLRYIKCWKPGLSMWALKSWPEGEVMACSSEAAAEPPGGTGILWRPRIRLCRELSGSPSDCPYTAPGRGMEGAETKGSMMSDWL